MPPNPQSSYPRAIMHFDGDAFFASVEQSLDYTLKGKPVVTGAERGAATSISYEAKARGVTRGMSMRDIKKMCPDAVIVPGNYTAYSIYAKRMYAIVRSFTPLVEEYSIDECFAEITGLDVRLGITYEQIGQQIKDRLEEELGITFGVGLAPTKTLAKAASKFRKPSGFTAIPVEKLEHYLAQMRIGSIWGLGGVSSLHLQKLGIMTAWEFAEKPGGFLDLHHFPKPIQEIWHELNGRLVKKLVLETSKGPGSIMKTHTFRPTTDRSAVLSELSKNIENACVKVRQHGMKAKAISIYVKTQEFTYHNLSLDLAVALSDPGEVLRLVESVFDDLYVPGVLYRATGVTLRVLVAEHALTPDLFGAHAVQEKQTPMLKAVDTLNRRYGRHTLYLGSSMQALGVRAHSLAARAPRHIAMPIEARRKSLNIPYLGTVR